VNFKKLLDDGKIEKVEKEIFSLDISLKDISSAKNSFNSEDYDWSINIAYTAVLKCCMGMMQSMGYRAIGKEHHKNTFEFMKETGFDIGLIDYFDKIRKTRNKFMYGFFEENNKRNAEETILKAEDFVQKMRTFVHKIGTGEKNG